MKLTIELVPQSSWGNNLRSEANLSKAQWDKLRKASYKRAGYRCEICSGKGSKWPVECHEIWEYDDQKHIQTLKGLISLCPTCHKAKHIGRTLSVEPPAAQALVLNQLATLNQMTPVQLEEYLVHVFEVWGQRSQHQWTLDLTWLDTNI
jgi:hypothetical protein